MEPRITDHGTHSMMELTISKPGKLGIEFRSTSSPYFVINVSPEAQQLYGVQPGDLLLSVKRESDSSWTDTDGLDWAALVDILKHRPSLAVFKRFKIQSQDRASSSSSSNTPLEEPPTLVPEVPNPEVRATPVKSELEPKPALFYHPSPIVRGESSPKPVQAIKSPFNNASSSPKESVSPFSGLPPQAPSPTARRPSSHESISEVTVVYSAEGPLGLEFEEMDYPFRVGGVRPGSMSAEKGVRRGDSLKSINGRATKGMKWEDIRGELSKRPATVIFLRDPSLKETSSSIWDVAAGLMRAGASTPDLVDELRKERDELRQIVSTVGAEDLIVLRQIAREYDSLKSNVKELETQIDTLKQDKDAVLNSLEEERGKNTKLVEVIEEIEKSQSAIIERFEKEIQEKERVISELRVHRDRSESNLNTSDAALKLEVLKETMKETEAKLELMEKDNTRLRKENMDLGGMVQQCLEKIKRDLSDKPHWVDRRVVCSAISTFLQEMNRVELPLDGYMSATQKLGDVLGMTYEERTAVGLLTVPSRYMQESASPEPHSIGEDFVNFLEREATKDEEQQV